jgi:hypothetical protein
MGAHDHTVATEFSVDVLAYLTGLGLKNISSGTFKSSQPAPTNGKEFKYNGANWVKF